MPERIQTHSQEIPQLLNQRELAPVLSCCPRTINKLAKVPGALPPHVQIGGRRFWALTDVARWLANGGSAQATAGSATI